MSPTNALLPLVIFVHGLTGATLWDSGGPKPRQVWPSRSSADLAKIELDPADPSRARDPTADIRVYDPVAGVYSPILLALRALVPELREFVYDWRVDIRVSAQQLADFIMSLRSKRSEGDGQRPDSVVLIGHSMGGLVIKWCVTHFPDHVGPLKRIITIGTPYRGSMQVVEGLMLSPKNPLIWHVLNQRRLRIAQRTMPSVYQMIPRWPAAAVSTNDRGENPGLDLFDPANWPTTFLDQLSRTFSREYVPRVLQQAREVSDTLAQPYPQHIADRLCIAVGEGTPTPRQIIVDTGPGGNRFHLHALRRDRLGDGIVHQCSARIPAAETHVARRHTKDRFRLLGQHVGMIKNRAMIEWILNKVRETASSA